MHVEILSNSYLSRACIRLCIRSLRANFRSFASNDKMDGSSACSEMFECLSCNDMTLTCDLYMRRNVQLRPKL